MSSWNRTGAERQAEEVAGEGVYRLRHTFADQGQHELVARVWVHGEDRPAPPLVIAATQEVHPREGAKEPMGFATLSALHGAGMVLMMVLLMGRFL